MSATTYQAILFSPAGEFITCYRAPTIEDVWSRVNNRGSEWFFYPIPFVITDHSPFTTSQHLISAPDDFESFVGSTVATLITWLHAHPDWFGYPDATQRRRYEGGYRERQGRPGELSA